MEFIIDKCKYACYILELLFNFIILNLIALYEFFLIGEEISKNYFTRCIYYIDNRFWFKTLTGSVRKYLNIYNIYEDKWIECLNFASYNYLGFEPSDIVWKEELIKGYEKYGISSCNEYLKKLENVISNFIDKEEVILSTTGFSVNAILLSELFNNGDHLIISDGSNHASIVEGLKLRNDKCLLRKIKHNNFKELENILEKNKYDNKTIWVITEGIFSCYGELLDLPRLIKLKSKYNFKLIIDEAHSFGCIGKNGKGICDYFNIPFKEVDIIIGTFSKTFNSQGGFISGNKDILKNINKENIISNIPVVSIIHIINIIKFLESENGKTRIKNLYDISLYAKNKFLKNGLEIYENKNISPVLCIKEQIFFKAMYNVYKCFLNGLSIVLVGYPASSKLFLIKRICLNSKHNKHDINYLIDNLTEQKEVIKYINKKELSPYYYTNINDIIKNFGIGTSGPRGFYGNLTIHQDLEKSISKFVKYDTSFFFPCYITGLSNSLEEIIKYSKEVNINTYLKYNIIIQRTLKLISKNIKINYIKQKYDIIVKHKFKKDTKIKLHMNDIKYLKYINTCDNDIILSVIKKDNYNYGGFLSSSYKFKKDYQLSIRSYIFSASSPSYVVFEILNYINSL